MNESSSRQAEQLFLVALELEPEKRTTFLEEACAGNPEMRAEVEALLEASALSSDYFAKLPERLGVAGVISGAEEPQPVGEAGQQYGHYRLTEPLGSGGMGAVWRAARSDGRFEGEVAVKLLARGTGVAGAERFAREARYLAKLAHPNIARLLDAGVGDNGQPYLVLEFVEGLAVERFCDEHALGIEQRIRLFLAVLDAVVHAHANLIVHRDIKPSNVQVAADGTVKLLDFGVAKLLSDEITGAPGLTRELGAALTPEFAAPEQLNGEAVTTATDIYSLGLLLWLLLTGSNPREAADPRSLAELRALARKEPHRLLDAVIDSPSPDRLAHVAERRNASPSELTKALRSDLDNIVRKALAVDPAERYDTVADFAQDLRRYLHNEPVAAQAQTIRYRAQKFVRRHRGSVLAASLTAIALIAAVVVTTWQSIEARQQRDIAIYHQQRVQAINEFLTFLFDEVGPGGGALTMGELLDRGVAMLDRQYGDAGRFAGAMYYDIARRYHGIGQIDRMRELLARAETIARDEADSDLLAATLCSTALAEYRSQPDVARAHVTEASAVLAENSRPSTEATIACARAEAIMLELEHEPEAALDLLSTTLEHYTVSPFASPYMQGVLLNDIGNMHFKMGRLDLAVDVLEQILDLHRESGRDDSVGYLVVSLNRAVLLHAQGEVLRAHQARADLIQRVRELEENGRTPPGFWMSYASSLVRLARYDEALQVLLDERNRAGAAGDATEVAEANLFIGRVLMLRGQADEAVPYLDQAEEFLRRTPGVSGGLLQILSVVQAKLPLVRGDIAEAKRLSDELLSRRPQPAGGRGPGLIALRLATEVAIAAGDAALAERHASEFHQEAVARSRDPATSADVGEALLLRAKARRIIGDLAGTRSDLELALPPLTAGLGEEHPSTIEAHELLASLP